MTTKNDCQIKKELLSVIDKVESNLNVSWNLETVSSSANISKFHFHRVFKALTGTTLSKYIWIRRLSESIEDLNTANRTITEIAVAHGFSDSSSYTHAFKRYFGITPSDYRAHPISLHITDRIREYDFYELDGNIIKRPDIISHPSFCVTGKRHKIIYGENKAQNKAYQLGANFYFHKSHSIQNAVNPLMYTGITIFPSEDADFTWYIPSLEVTEHGTLPTGMEHLTIPTQNYAVFRYVGHHHIEFLSQNMRPLFEHIFLTWMPKLGDATVSMNIERIPWNVCKDDYCQLTLFYAF